MPATMREVFIESTGRMLENNPDSVVVLADWFIKVGIREQLMVGVAAGLAKEGFRPLVHSYTPFLLE